MVILETCALFRNLERKELECLCQAAQTKSFADGAEIFREGDRGDGLYVVVEGLVAISGLVAENVRHEYSKFGKGDFFGEMAILEDKPRSATAISRGHSTVYFIPREDMLKLVAASPELALSLVREISRRLREFNRQYIQGIIQTERLSLVGRFARSIVHDLKNPLNIISLTAELSVMDRATPEMRRIASTRITAMVERITELVNEILDFTQGSSNTAFVAAPTSYSKFVNHLIEEMRPETELKSVTIHLENMPPDVKLNLDTKRLRRVFYNLIHNATDAMSGGGKILIRFSATDSEVLTELEDTGPGIAPQIATQLFDAFATYGKAHGTGLGLSICKKIVLDHKGKITARNEPGRGAIFTFVLPIAKS